MWRVTEASVGTFIWATVSYSVRTEFSSFLYLQATTVTMCTTCWSCKNSKCCAGKYLRFAFYFQNKDRFFSPNSINQLAFQWKRVTLFCNARDINIIHIKLLLRKFKRMELWRQLTSVYYFHIVYSVHCDIVGNLCNTNKCTILYFIRSVFCIPATCFGVIISPSSGSWHKHFYDT
jgi:hypothetical protein